MLSVINTTFDYLNYVLIKTSALISYSSTSSTEKTCYVDLTYVAIVLSK